MRLPGVDRSFPDPSTFPNPSTPQRRCRHKSLTDRRKPSDGCCQNCVSWTDTSAALPRAETERLSLLGQQLRVASRQTKPIFLHLSNGLPNGTARIAGSQMRGTTTLISADRLTDKRGEQHLFLLHRARDR